MGLKDTNPHESVIRVHNYLFLLYPIVLHQVLYIYIYPSIYVYIYNTIYYIGLAIDIDLRSKAMCIARLCP